MSGITLHSFASGRETANYYEISEGKGDLDVEAPVESAKKMIL